jgi:hypothetical protein
MKNNLALKLTLVAATLLASAQSLAFPNGITGRSGSPVVGTDGKTCFGCHLKPRGTSYEDWEPPYTVETETKGPQLNANDELQSVRPNSITDLQVSMLTEAFYAGYNLSVTSGELADLGDPNSQILVNSKNSELEATHTGRIELVPAADDKNHITWAVSWQAPAEEGSATVYWCVNPVSNGDDGTENDGAKEACKSLEIQVLAGENQAPVAGDDSDEVIQGVATPIDVLANDSDDSQILLSTIKIESAPAQGNTAVVDKINGNIIYTPAADFAGSDSFSYSITDGECVTDDNDICTQDEEGNTLYTSSNTATVTLSVLTSNGAPAVGDMAFNTLGTTPVLVDVLTPVNEVYTKEFTASDVVITMAPANGTAVVEEDGTISYIADSGFDGIDDFKYTIVGNDGTNDDEGTIEITVTEKLSSGSDAGTFGSAILAMLALFGFSRKVKANK